MNYLDSFTEYYKMRSMMALKEADNARNIPFRLSYLTEAKEYLKMELIERNRDIKKKYCR